MIQLKQTVQLRRYSKRDPFSNRIKYKSELIKRKVFIISENQKSISCDGLNLILFKILSCVNNENVKI